MATQKGPAKTPRQQLSKSMEHIRYAVTVDPPPSAKPHTISEETSATEAESSNQSQPSESQIELNPSRSHDPSNNLKRTDPFQFGTRYLEAGDDPFEFNAWDHVQVDDAYRSFSEQQFEFQRSAPVSDFDKARFNGNPAKFWNAFYNNNTTNFFKNRKWLAQEFPILNEVTKADAPETVLLEVGAGAGNTAYPILALNENERLKIHACDFSAKAVDLIRNHEEYASPNIQADVWDAASPELPPGLVEGSVDVVLMVFIFSALAPAQWKQCVDNIYRVLKPGGYVLFRDYGRGDLAQVRFKKGRYLEENFYIRGDGTRVYFFEAEELEQIWGGVLKKVDTKDEDSGDISKDFQQLSNRDAHDEAAQQDSTTLESAQSSNFQIVNIGADRRMLVNRQRKLKMYRCWMQAVFRKPGSNTFIDSLPKEAIIRSPPNHEELSGQTETVS